MMKAIGLAVAIGLGAVAPSHSQTLEKQHYTYSDFAKT